MFVHIISSNNPADRNNKEKIVYKQKMNKICSVHEIAECLFLCQFNNILMLDMSSFYKTKLNLFSGVQIPRLLTCLKFHLCKQKNYKNS